MYAIALIRFQKREKKTTNTFKEDTQTPVHFDRRILIANHIISKTHTATLHQFYVISMYIYIWNTVTGFNNCALTSEKKINRKIQNMVMH